MAYTYAQSALNTAVATMVSGTYTDANFLTIANIAVRNVISDLDLRGTKRKSALSPNLFDDIYDYSAPSDLKGIKIIDLAPQIDRGRYDDWSLRTVEEFDRLKSDERVDRFGDPINLKYRENWLGESMIAVQENDTLKKIKVSRPLDTTQVTISPLSAVGTWIAFGDGTNLTADATNYVTGSASVNWDINSDGGTTAGIVNSSLTTFDVSAYKSLGSIFVWSYITSATNLTNFIIRVGSDSSNYYSITITTNNEATSFYAGWNLLRFDFVNKTTTGTPDDDACTYSALYMTKAAGKVSETDYRFNNLIMAIGDHYNLHYYSKYGWQSSTGTYLENATATTDKLNADTDEINLIELKTAQLVEQSLKNYAQADRLEKMYEIKKTLYKQTNPSEAMALVYNYYTV